MGGRIGILSVCTREAMARYVLYATLWCCCRRTVEQSALTRCEIIWPFRISLLNVPVTTDDGYQETLVDEVTYFDR